ncbi:hypothetical protein GmHk_15G045304 [Glycine max]|nr:hypothetical protein GmHk_15G045304 [Glycine max]
MVRTKGFCRALGRVSDDEEVTQRQRPTTLTRRQRAIVVVAEDIEHMDHAADEAHEEHHDPVTDDECTELKLAYHGRKMKKFERPALEIEGIVAVTDLVLLLHVH